MIKDELFWDKVNKRENGCWEWTGSHISGRYGSIKRGGKTLLTHRYSWYLAYGEFPDKNICVCHKCDNGFCVNPDHLFEGTQQDNIDDMHNKDRHAKGSINGSAKLSEDDVKEIKRLLKTSMTQTEISDLYGVKQNTISGIKTGKFWKHVK